ncbi:MAG TPA: protein kinase family protein, partial [Coleofasciculaceae cyanobacterium]
LTISIGTKGYMPNEQLAGNPRFSSDVHAVGMLGIQALTGRHPKRLKENPETGEIDWQQYAKQVTPELVAILDQMVRYDFRDRFPTATEALEALQSLPEVLRGSEPSSMSLSAGGEALSNLEPHLPTDNTESSHTELEEPPTDMWISTEPPVKSATVASTTDLTESLSSSASPQPPSESSGSTSASPAKLKRQWMQFWPVAAALGAIGTTTVVTQSFLPFQSANLMAYFGNRVSTENPTIHPVESPTPTPSPLTPEQQAAEFLKQAEDLRKAGQYQEALNLYDKVLDRKPNLAQAYWGRCDSLNKLKKPAEAVVACNDAIDLKPNYAEALWGKGVAFDQQKLPLEALQLYHKATRIKPNFTEAWVSYGVALQGFGRSEEAIIALNKAIALKRNSAVAWATKGEALWNLGRFEPAIASLDKALQIQPNHSKALKLRQKIREELGR